jgi:hypothetical protein
MHEDVRPMGTTVEGHTERFYAVDQRFNAVDQMLA